MQVPSRAALRSRARAGGPAWGLAQKRLRRTGRGLRAAAVREPQCPRLRVRRRGAVKTGGARIRCRAPPHATKRENRCGVKRGGGGTGRAAMAKRRWRTPHGRRPCGELAAIDYRNERNRIGRRIRHQTLPPSRSGVSKQLLPIYDKPMVYYPRRCSMLAGIRGNPDYLDAAGPAGIPASAGRRLGLRHPPPNTPSSPRPTAWRQAFLIGAGVHWRRQRLPGAGRQHLLTAPASRSGCARPCAMRRSMRRPPYSATGWTIRSVTAWREFDKEGAASRSRRNPSTRKSNYAVVGLYFYPNKVVDVAKRIKPIGPRRAGNHHGEPGVPLRDGELKVRTLDRGFA